MILGIETNKVRSEGEGRRGGRERFYFFLVMYT